MKKCTKCGSEMFESMEPKVTILANDKNKLTNISKYWRCSNDNCGYKKRI